MNKIKGAIYIICIGFLSVMNDLIQKYLFYYFDGITIMGLRCFSSLLISLLFLRTINISAKKIFNLHNLLRSILSLCAVNMVIHGLKIMPIHQMDMINYLIPIMTGVLSWFFFKEKININNWILGIISFVILIIFNNNISGNYIIMGATLLYAVSELWIKYFLPNHNILEITLPLNIMGVCGFLWKSSIINIFHLLNHWTLPLILLLGLGDLGIQYCICRSYKYLSMSSFIPLKYMSIIFAVCVDKIFFKGSINYLLVSLICSLSIINVIIELSKK